MYNCVIDSDCKWAHSDYFKDIRIGKFCVKMYKWNAKSELVFGVRQIWTQKTQKHQGVL